MKIYGMLEVAQAELIASASPTPTPTGRFYMDITSASKGVPRIYDGSAWRPILMGQTASLVSQNSSVSCTVDWSTGLYQQVILTGHCTINFANPQSGQEHVLVVQQQAMENTGVYKTPFQFKFNLSDQDSRRQSYQPIGCIQTSENQVFRWFYSTTIKAGYATVSVANAAPSTLPASQSNGIDVSPDAKYVCSGNTTTPFSSVYPIYDGGAGFYYGNKNVVTPTATAAAVVGVVYSPDGNLIFTVGGTTPFIQGWYLDRGTPITVLSNPGTLPTGAGQSIAMHPSGLAVVVGHTTTPFVTGYPITAGAYGTKYTNPVTLPAALVTSLAFSTTGDYLTVVSQTTPFIQTYPFDPITGYGAVVANPGSLPAGGPAGSVGKGVAWRPQGDFIAVAMTTTPWLYIVNFNRTTGAYGSSVSTSASTLTAATNCVQWTPDGQYLLVGSATTPFLFVYDFSAQTIGAPVTIDNSATGGGAVNDMVVLPNGEYVVLSLNVSPFIKTFALPRKARNYLKLIQ